jgi:hypothetical protein
MNQRFFLVLSGLLFGLGMVIRISAITPFAVRLSYVIIVLGILGILLYLIARVKRK